MRKLNIDLQALKNQYNIVGKNEALNTALKIAIQVAPTDLSVLIEGENGVGKEIIPRIIHDFSPCKNKKYLAINCGSIPEGTIDSELFGHEKVPSPTPSANTKVTSEQPTEEHSSWTRLASCP